MIIKNLYKKITIHLFFYVVALISILTGLFKEFLIFSLIIVIHESGHILAALYYKWKIDKVIILPFGGLTIFKETLNRPIYEEFIITVMGPLSQILFYFVYNLIFGYNNLIMNYHYAILLFNILPIYPLDGAKIINLLLCKYISFKMSHLFTILLSIVIIIIALVLSFIYKINFVFFLILFFLIVKIYSELKNHNFIFNKFLFERYIYDFPFNKRKIIRGNRVNKMYRDYKHLFYIDNRYCLEREILQKRFDFK